MTARAVIAVAGEDREAFLQGLVTNDVRRLRDGPTYAALLTPQGKYLADFLMVADGDRILLDVAEPLAGSLAQRLAMYRLRARVAVEPTGLRVACGPGAPPPGAFADPRHPGLGWRAIGADSGDAVPDRDALRVAHGIPESGVELGPETYILEAGFERLHGVDFRKGCYVGQEVTARMRHKTELRKGLVRVAVDGAAPVGTAIVTADGREAGTLFTQSGGRALAHLRHDRATGPMTAGDARVTWDGTTP